MSNTVYKVFEEVEFKANLLAKYWNNFHTEISQHLPKTYQPEMQELSNNLEKALSQLVDELRTQPLFLVMLQEMRTQDGQNGKGYLYKQNS